MHHPIIKPLLRCIGFTGLWFVFGAALAMVYWRYVYDISGPLIWMFTQVLYPLGLLFFLALDYCWRRNRVGPLRLLLLLTLVIWAFAIPFREMHFSNVAERIDTILMLVAVPVFAGLYGFSFFKGSRRTALWHIIFGTILSYFVASTLAGNVLRMLKHL